MEFTLPDPGPVNPEFARPASRADLERAAAALAARGFAAHVADSGKEARRLVLEALPEGAEVHIALSETMRALGLTAEIDESGRYDSVRAKLNALDRETQASERRKLGAAPDYMLGSAHAITDDGVVVVGSGSGSQLGAYAYAAGSVILVVATTSSCATRPRPCAASASTRSRVSSPACRTRGTRAPCSPRCSRCISSPAAASGSSCCRRRSASDLPAAIAACRDGAYPRRMALRWLTGFGAFWVAFPAVSAGGPAYLVPIGLGFVAWAALVAYAADEPVRR
jgi:hypothetical protein